MQDGTNLTDLSSGSSSTSTGPLPPYGGAPTPTGPENPVDLSSSRPVIGGPQPGHPGANPALPDSTGKSVSKNTTRESLSLHRFRQRQEKELSWFFSENAVTHSVMRGIIPLIHKCLSPPVGDFSLSPPFLTVSAHRHEFVIQFRRRSPFFRNVVPPLCCFSTSLFRPLQQP